MNEVKTDAGLSCGCLVLIAAASFALSSFCWTYSINTWLLWAGKEPAVEWWQGGLLGLVPGLGQLSPAAAALTWVVGFFV